MIAARIFEIARAEPGREALRHNGQSWSYGAFAALIARARAVFIGRGLTGEGIVVLAVRNLADYWVLNLALRSLGLTTVAIRSAEMLGDLGLDDARSVVATDPAGWPGLEALCAERGLALFEPSLDGAAAIDLDAGPGGWGGQILLTSGTTGRFKKVLYTPLLETGYIEDRRGLLSIDATCVYNLFDFPGWTGAGYKAPMAAWGVGGVVVFTQAEGPEVALRQADATHGIVVPHMLQKILAAPEGTFPYNPGLHLSITGGAVTRAEIAAARRRITPHLYNRLGATESAVFGFTPLASDADHGRHRLVAGRAVEIVDEHDKPLPAGGLGRVRVSTADAPDGYFRDPETSAQFFRDGFFFPGDLGLIDDDGRLRLNGRATEIINVDGTKLSPAPVEERLRAVFGLTGACLLSMQNPQGEEVVHLVLESGVRIDEVRLKRELLATIGEGRVALHYLAELPRTPTGKIVRRAVCDLIAGR